jgi:predicted metal-dependent hydrolase
MSAMTNDADRDRASDHASDVVPEFWQGVEEFNQQQFYQCHDTLEAIWMTAVEPQKTFYQGILQVAVALYHLGNQNQRGAVILLGEGIHRLRRYGPSYANVDLDGFVRQSTALLSQLQQADATQVAAIALAMSEPRGTLPEGIELPYLMKVGADTEPDFGISR